MPYDEGLAKATINYRLMALMVRGYSIHALYACAEQKECRWS